jgi:N-acetylmuramoyl-L-alanine amidase
VSGVQEGFSPLVTPNVDFAGRGLSVRKRLVILLGMGVGFCLLFIALTFQPARPGYAEGRVICIDPGHGGLDGGAVNESLVLAEDEIVLDISLRLQALLEDAGYGVVLTRITDVDNPTLWERVVTCREANADLLLSIHVNSSVADYVDGTMMLYIYPEDRELAEALQAQMYPALSQSPEVSWEMLDYGVRYYNAAVLRWWNDRPGVVVEPAMLTHDGEAALLAAQGPVSRRQEIALALLDGIEAYYRDEPAGVAPVPPPTAEPPPSEGLRGFNR